RSVRCSHKSTSCSQYDFQDSRIFTHVAHGSPRAKNLEPFMLMQKLGFHNNTNNAICSKFISLCSQAEECLFACFIHNISVLFEFAMQSTFSRGNYVVHFTHCIDTVSPD